MANSRRVRMTPVNPRLQQNLGANPNPQQPVAQQPVAQQPVAQQPVAQNNRLIFPLCAVTVLVVAVAAYYYCYSENSPEANDLVKDDIKVPEMATSASTPQSYVEEVCSKLTKLLRQCFTRDSEVEIADRKEGCDASYSRVKSLLYHGDLDGAQCDKIKADKDFVKNIETQKGIVDLCSALTDFTRKCFPTPSFEKMRPSIPVVRNANCQTAISLAKEFTNIPIQYDYVCKKVVGRITAHTLPQDLSDMVKWISEGGQKRAEWACRFLGGLVERCANLKSESMTGYPIVMNVQSELPEVTCNGASLFARAMSSIPELMADLDPKSNCLRTVNRYSSKG